MNASPASARRPLLYFTNAFEPKPVTFIYAIGVVCWVVVTFVLGFESKERDFSYAILEAFGSAWQTAFLWSLGAVALASAVYCIKSKKSLLAVVVNTMIFASPFALFLLGTWTLDGFYLHHPATVEMTKLFGPILMLFYVIGILYMSWRTPQGREEALPAFMLSTTTAVVLVLGLTGAQLFSSNEYIYRNAFEVLVESVDRKGTSARVHGILTINKPGSYVFSAMDNSMEFYPGEAPQTLTIEWDGKSSAPSEAGQHKFHITVPNARPAGLAMAEPPTMEGVYENLSGGPELYFQVSLPPKDGKPSTFIKGLPIWLEEFQ